MPIKVQGNVDLVNDILCDLVAYYSTKWPQLWFMETSVYFLINETMLEYSLIVQKSLTYFTAQNVVKN